MKIFDFHGMDGHAAASQLLGSRMMYVYWKIFDFHGMDGHAAANLFWGSRMMYVYWKIFDFHGMDGHAAANLLWGSRLMYVYCEREYPSGVITVDGYFCAKPHMCLLSESVRAEKLRNLSAIGKF